MKQTPDPGANLRAAMRNKGATPADLVSLTGSAQSAVSNWRKRGVSTAHLDKVADFLGVKPELIASNPAVVKASKAPRQFIKEETERLALQVAENKGAALLETGDPVQVLERQLAELRAATDSTAAQDYRTRKLLSVLDNLSPRQIDLLIDVAFEIAK